MNDINELLEFITHLGREMLQCGANLERVNLAIEKICRRYKLKEVSLNNLNTSIMVSAKDGRGNYATRQLSVMPASINLEMLRKLNRLSYNISQTLPPSSKLMSMLEETLSTNKTIWWIKYLGYLGAMSCLCRIFNGTIQDILIALLNTSILYCISLLISKTNINKIISNFISMFIATSIALLFTYVGFVRNFYTVIITNAFFLIPGIPMVNSIRNILCGNEMNGIISLLKVFIEGISLVGGLAAAYFFFAQGWHTHQIEDTLTSSSLDIIQIIELVTLSFIASLSFGIVFNVGFKDIVFSGIGGAIVRIVYVLFSMITEYRIVYTIVAAFCAALYAEILAITRKEPGTVYLYPSIIPLIPGDLLYYTSLGILWGNSSLLVKAGDCAIQLFAMSIGFVLCSTIIHYIRKIRFKKLIKALENSFITK